MPKPTPLAIELLRIDGDTQSRVKINEDTVEDYATLIEQNGKEWPFPPLDVFHDGSEYFVADGFHRLLAGLKAKRGSVPCNVHKGTARDARIFGMTANDQHGLRMTRADKRACVEWLLDNGGKITQTEIAAKSGTSKRLVQMVVADRNAQKAQVARPSGGGGGTPPEPPEPPQDAPEPNPPSEHDSPPKGRPAAAQGPDGQDLGKCPVCAGTKWIDGEDGVVCKKCNQPHGEPGDSDEDLLKTQKSKTVKTAEALLRAFDDLQTMKARPEYDEAILRTKQLVAIARGWK